MDARMIVTLVVFLFMIVSHHFGDRTCGICCQRIGRNNIFCLYLCWPDAKHNLSGKRNRH